MLPYYEREYEQNQNNTNFESATKFLMRQDYEMVVTRQFERIYNMMECKLYKKNEDIPENKEIFIYEFK